MNAQVDLSLRCRFPDYNCILVKHTLLQVSGLSLYVGKQLEIFKEYDTWVMNLVICCIVAAATEVTSNTATSQLLLPIMFTMVSMHEDHQGPQQALSVETMSYQRQCDKR